MTTSSPRSRDRRRLAGPRALVVVVGALLATALVAGAPTSAGAQTPAASTLAAATPVPLVPGRLLVQRSMENRVIALTNRQRRAHGCAPLRGRSTLTLSARRHSVTMAAANLMSHQLPGEPYFSKRITRAGYRNWRLVAENVAHGFSGPEAVVAAWMASPGHRRNILDCRLRDIGVGVVTAGGSLWWTQNFGRR